MNRQALPFPWKARGAALGPRPWLGVKHSAWPLSPFPHWACVEVSHQEAQRAVSGLAWEGQDGGSSSVLYPVEAGRV